MSGMAQSEIKSFIFSAGAMKKRLHHITSSEVNEVYRVSSMSVKQCGAYLRFDVYQRQ